MVRGIITDFSMNAWWLALDSGITNALDHVTNNQANNNESFRTEWSVPEAGLRPSTKYYFRLTVVSGNGTARSTCSDGETGIGWTCEPGGGFMIFTTTPLPANHGEPAPPAAVDTAYPTVNGSTFTVAADCSDLQAKLQACADADTSLVHVVSIPSSAVCRGFGLPMKVGPGTCIVRTSAPDSQLPPEGTRITNDYESVMPRIVKPLGNASGLGVFGSTDGTQGWRLVGLRFGLDSATTHRKIDISNIAADGTITTSTPHGLAYGDQIYISGVTGFAGRGPNGAWLVYGISSATSFTIQDTSYSQVGTPNFTGAYGGQG